MDELEKEKLSKPFRLTELGSYSSGSILSRSIKKSDAGNITYFAFAKGEQLSTHSAPFDALVQILEGEANVMVGEEWYTLHTGEAVLFPENIPHAVKATQNMKMLLVMIKEKSS